MLRTYRALLHGDRIEWIERPTIPPHAVPVHVTLLEEEIVEAAVGRGPAMAAALEALADPGAAVGAGTPPPPTAGVQLAGGGGAERQAEEDSGPDPT